MRRRFKSACIEPTRINGNKALTRRSDQFFDMKKAKRVRFVDTEADGVPDHASSRRYEANQSPRSDAPKTSEYAYFRNVKNSNVRGHSRSVHKENRESKSSKTDYLTRETSNASGSLTTSTKDVRFSSQEETAGPSNRYFFLSPPANKHNEQDRIRTEDLTNNTKQRSLSGSKNVTPVGEQLSSSPLKASKISGNQCSEKGIFAATRQRLHQRVLPTSFSDVQGQHPKGCDLVASLLSRLIPKGEERYDSSTGHYHRSKSLPRDEPNNREKGLQQPHSGKWDEDLPKNCAGSFNETFLSERNAFVTGFSLPNFGKENRFSGGMIGLDQHPDNRKRNSHTRQDFAFCLPIERYGSSGSCYIEELDGFCSPVEHAREEPDKLFLEWDFKRGINGVDSSIINYDSAENLYPRLATSWHADHQKFSNDVVDARALCSSSSRSNYYLEYNSTPNYQTTSCLVPDFGPNFEDVKRAMAEKEQFYLTSPYTQKSISLGESINAENILCTNFIDFPYRDQILLNNKVRDRLPRSDSWQKFLYDTDSSAEDDASIFQTRQFPESETSLYSFPRLEEAPKEPLIPLSEGAFNHNFWSSNFQPSFELVNRPLSFYGFSENLFQKDLYFEDENELEYM